MARMIPHIAYNTGSEGEDTIFKNLQTQLSDEYVVLHSLRWIGSDRKRSQGEADFAIFHPNKGVIALEVKAGLIDLDENRTWWQTNRNTGIPKAIVDPEKQADESKFKFISVLEGLGCMVCHSVWFPSVSFNPKNLPPNYHPDMLLDEGDLNTISDSIDKVFAYWSKQLSRTTALSDYQSKEVVRRLAPEMHLVPSLKVDYDSRENQFIQLTNDQAKILDFLQLQNKAAIAGSAGTGKTVIALEKARQMALDGRKVLFLCYNRLLSDYLKENYSHEGVSFATFDSLCWQYVGEQPSFEKARLKFQAYLIEKDNKFEFTDIIIDEGQDFDSEWIEYLEYRMEEEACFYVFYDQNQCLYTNDLSKWLREAPCRLTLSTNCRNTEAIAKTAYGSLGFSSGKQPNLSGIAGDQPTLLSIEDPKELANWIDKEVKSFVTETKIDFSSVALLTMNSMDGSKLSSALSFSKLPYDGAKTKGKICATTSRRFKGMEADLIIITDVDWNRMDDKTYRNLLYTSCSRAKHRLFILSQPLEDVNIDFVLKHTQSEDSKKKGIRRFRKLFNLNTK